jgi:hypothetical protein
MAFDINVQKIIKSHFAVVNYFQEIAKRFPHTFTPLRVYKSLTALSYENA